VTIRQVISAASGTTTATTSLAVTLTPAAASGWAVYDIAPAGDGNT
jgi:hypothetical protein